MHYDVRVPSDAGSVSVVRRTVETATRGCGGDISETVALIFSELVTNAVRHAGLQPQDCIEVELTVDPDHGLRGSVSDPGGGFEVPGEGPRPKTNGGFGLFIVDRLARRWGVERSPGGTTVWFEL